MQEVIKLVEKIARVAENIANALKKLEGKKVTYKKGNMKPAEATVKETSYSKEKGVVITVTKASTGKDVKLTSLDNIINAEE